MTDRLTGTPENGLEQFYNFADALAMASWLNVFVRQADVVDIAPVKDESEVLAGPRTVAIRVEGLTCRCASQITHRKIVD